MRDEKKQFFSSLIPHPSYIDKRSHERQRSSYK
jgi:hypothetical protein